MASIIYSHVTETLTYGTTCMSCRKSIVIKNIPAGEYAAWTSGKPIHVALSSLTPGEREAMISNVCEPCFDALIETRDEKEEQQ